MLFNQEEHRDRSHAQRLPFMIKDALSELEIKNLGLDGVAVSAGPGSYTGLRIGVSMAKGICLGFDIPLISVSTLELIYEGFKNEVEGEFDFYIPMVDARRMEVYHSIFDKHGKALLEDEALVLEEGSFGDLREKGNCVFFGDGSKKFKELIGEKNPEEFNGNIPFSKYMAELASIKFSAKKFEDLAYFEPKYVKDVFVTTPKKILG